MLLLLYCIKTSISGSLKATLPCLFVFLTSESNTSEGGIPVQEYFKEAFPQESVDTPNLGLAFDEFLLTS